MKRLPNLVRTCSRLGLRGTARLVNATVLAPLLTLVWRSTLVGYTRLDSIRRVVTRRARMRRWRRRVAEAFLLGPAGRAPDPEPALAEIGRGPVLGSNRVDGHLHAAGPEGVRRTYGGRTEAFLNELEIIQKLGLLGISVPQVLDIDFDEPAMVTSPVGIDKVTPSSPQETVTALGAELQRIHRAGVVLGGFSTDMVVVDSRGKPCWVDFASATDHSRLPWGVFRFLADADVESFNHIFGTSYPTYRELRAMARSRALAQYFGSYSPAYLGSGIRTGPIWSLGSGWGRWESILGKALPDPVGKRVLDLGSNNGHNGLEMLRAGAEQVIGIELNPERVAQGERLKQVYEWSDGRPYPYVGFRADMRDVAAMGLGTFDMVTALCSLYYLAEDEMIRLVSKLREIAPVLVLECNQRQDIGRSDSDTYRRASLEFNHRVLTEGGFEHVEVIAPSWSERPVLIGRG